MGIAVADVLRAVRTFEARYIVAEESPIVTANLLALLELGTSQQVHDTNIVATMLTYRISRIITNNPDDFAPFNDIISIIPLL